MKTRTLIVALLGAGVLAGAGYGLWWLGMSQGMQMMSQPMSAHSGASHGDGHTGMDATAGQATAASNASGVPEEDPSSWTIPQGEEATRRHMEQGIKAGDVDPVTGLRVLYYHDPMVPGRNFDAPSKSPFMDMMLVPEYAGAGGGDSSTVQISSRVKQNLGIRVAPVERGSLMREVVADGTIQWNERARSVVQARARGFVEDLRVTATLDRVKKGQVLLTLYVPDWVAAQQEFLALRKMSGSNLEPIIQAARQRMLQAGMDEQQIRLVEKSGELQARMAILAPRAGVVTDLMVREGMTVQPGMTLVEINGLDPIWAEAQVPEAQLTVVQPGVKVSASSRAFPGREFNGSVQAVLPQVSAGTRTVQARLSLDNPEGALLPGMFVRMNFSHDADAETLVVPSESIIFTGKRTVVMLSEEEGRYLPVEVKTGVESGGKTEILEGLKAGQRVVLSGQFLIDSEASLRGLQTRLNDAPQADLDQTYRTTAVFEYIDEPNMPMMTHPPIEELGWPEMTMQFEMPGDVLDAASLEEGEELEIEFKMQEGGVPMIVNAKPKKAGNGGGQ